MQYFWKYPLFSTNTSAELMLFKHMLATPLTSLQLCLQDSQASQLLPLHNQSWARQAHLALQRMTDVMTFFTNPAAIKQQPIPITTLIADLRSLFSHNAHEVTIKLLMQKPASLTIYGNKFLLEEALLCIIKNSFESYTKHEGKHVIITLWQKNKNLYIAIRDYGCGIQHWNKWLLQLPFVTSKKHGSGIGIPFARRVIETSFQGSLTLYAAPCRGTEVICMLPIQ